MPPSQHPTRLLAHALAADARIIALVAPAGYGKSTLARAIAVEYGGSSTVDCSRYGDAQALREAIAIADAADAPVLVIENAEALLAAKGSVEVIAERLGAAAHGSARIVICSRVHIPFGMRAMEPGSTHTIGAEDLALSEPEARDLLYSSGASDAQIARAVPLAAGWPMAIAMFARCARSGRLDAVLDAVSGTEMRDLMQFLTNDALASFDDSARLLIQVAAILPATRIEDLRYALAPVEADAVLETVVSTPFVRRDGNTIEIHPVVRHTLAHFPQDAALHAITKSARAQEDFAPARAAELYLCAGRMDDAAGVLQELGAQALRVGHVYNRLLARIDSSVLVRYPALWLSAAQSRLHRVSSAQYVAECQAVLQNLDRCDSPSMRAMITGLAVSVFHETLNGALVEDLLVRARNDAAEDAQASLVVEHFTAFHEAFLERAPDPGPLRNALAPMLAIPEIRFSFEATIAAPYERITGNIDRERAALELALESAMSSQMPALVPLGHWEVAYFYWRIGDRERYAQHLDACEFTLSDAQVPAFGALIACARGNGEAKSDAYPRLRLYAALMGAAACSDSKHRVRLLSQAKDLAESLRQRAQLALVELALAFTCDGERETHLAAALAAAREAGACALANAIERRDFSAPIISGIIAHFRSPSAPQAPELSIDVLRGAVQLHGNALDLSGRKFELLALLAVAQRNVTRSEIVSKIWPDLPEDRARNSLGVTFSALRDELGRDSIVFQNGAYGLRLRADVNINRIEALAKRIRVSASELLSTTDYDETARAADELEALDAGPPDWEWFKLTIARLWSIRRELLIALTRSDFVRGRTAHGLKRSETLVALDPCDEEARVLRLKLLLARGDRAAAFSEFREYARILHDDLGIEPSPDVLALLRSEDAVRSERPAIRR